MEFISVWEQLFVHTRAEISDPHTHHTPPDVDFEPCRTLANDASLKKSKFAIPNLVSSKTISVKLRAVDITCQQCQPQPLFASCVSTW